MYYNKELFLDKEIKAKFEKTEKLQTALILSISITVIIACLVSVLALRAKYGEDFLAGCFLAIFATTLFAAAYAVLIPTTVKLNKLRAAQIVQLKDTPLYTKYDDLHAQGRKLNKTNNLITLLLVVICVVAGWVLAILFPYNFYTVIPYLFVTIASNLLLIVQKNKVKKIQSTEQEIFDVINEQNNINAEVCDETVDTDAKGE